MKLIFFIIFLLLHTQLEAHNKSFSIGDTLFVWASNGLNVRKQPNMDSEVVAKLSYGDRVVVLEIVDREVQYEIVQSVKIKSQMFPAIVVNGKFVKVNWSGLVGYVYTGLLSSLKPIRKDERLEHYFARVFGQLKVVADIRHDNHDYRLKRIVYENGAVLQEESGNESVWSFLYLIPDVTVDESYLLIDRLTGFETEYRRCIKEASDWVEVHPTSFEPNNIVIQSGPFEETRIKRESHSILITVSGGD